MLDVTVLRGKITREHPQWQRAYAVGKNVKYLVLFWWSITLKRHSWTVSSPLDKYEALSFNIINSFVSKTTAAASKSFRRHRCANRSHVWENRVLAHWQTSTLGSQKAHLCIKIHCSCAGGSGSSAVKRIITAHLCVPMPSLVRQHRDPEAFIHNSQ